LSSRKQKARKRPMPPRGLWSSPGGSSVPGFLSSYTLPLKWAAQQLRSLAVFAVALRAGRPLPPLPRRMDCESLSGFQ
jgi:hypothetical protein